MRKSRFAVGSLILAGGLLFARSAGAQSVYTDALGDNYGGPEVDISNVVISNDASNIYFTINMNPSANLTTNYYANYDIGLQMNGGAGGQTLINGSYGTGVGNGNPYGDAVGISTGENYFIGTYLNGPTYSGGAQLYGFTAGTGWAQEGTTASISEIGTGTPGLEFAFPLSSLGLTVGSHFNFDVWTTFSGGQGAYDALDNTTGTPDAGGAPYSGGIYDSATASGSTFSSTVYTVTAVPEPATLGLLCLSGVMLAARRRSAAR